MLRALLIVSLMCPVSAFAAPGDLLQFLKTCGWGVAIGAGVGAVSLAFEDKPSEHTINIARGASLGLYGGIAYGLAAVNAPPPSAPPAEVWGVIPRFDKGQVSGLDVAGVVVSF